MDKPALPELDNVLPERIAPALTPPERQYLGALATDATPPEQERSRPPGLQPIPDHWRYDGSVEALPRGRIVLEIIADRTFRAGSAGALAISPIREIDKTDAAPPDEVVAVINYLLSMLPGEVMTRNDFDDLVPAAAVPAAMRMLTVAGQTRKPRRAVDWGMTRYCLRPDLVVVDRRAQA